MRKGLMWVLFVCLYGIVLASDVVISNKQPINAGLTELAGVGKGIVIFYENFEGGTVPEGWTVVDGNGDSCTWTVGTTDDLGSFEPPAYGTGYAYYSDDDAGVTSPPACEVLSTPPIPTFGLTSVTLSFSFGFHKSLMGYECFAVVITTSDSVIDTLDIITESDSGVLSYDLSEYLPADYVIISFVYMDLGGWNWAVAIDNVTLTGDASDMHDVAIAGLVFPNYPLRINQANEVGFVITNNGSSTETDIVLAVLLNDYIDTVEIPELAVNETTVVNFTYTTPEEEVLYILGCLIACPDYVPFNNVIAFSENIYPEGTIWVEGFEHGFPPSGWAVVNNDEGDESWERWPLCSHSGWWCAAVHLDACGNDDWLITGPITPEAGYFDSLGFFYLAVYERLQVWAMSGQDVEDTLALLWEDPGTDEKCYERVTIPLDDFDGTPIYIGFRGLSPDDCGLLLDDIFYMKVESGPTTVEEETKVKRNLTVDARCVGNEIVVNFALPKDLDVEIDIYDVAGRHILNLVSGRYSAGAHTVSMDAQSLRNGVYFVSMKAGDRAMTSKLTVIH